MASSDELEKNIGITFNNKDLLTEALTHRSYLNEYPRWPLPHNERLEYLGDAVLEFLVSEELFKKFPNEPEGQLTVFRAALVNYQILAKVAERIGLQKFILMSRGEKKDTGRAREVILANAMEALIGAIYLDQGFERMRPFVHEFVMSNLDEVLKNKKLQGCKERTAGDRPGKVEADADVSDARRVGPGAQARVHDGRLLRRQVDRGRRAARPSRKRSLRRQRTRSRNINNASREFLSWHPIPIFSNGSN